MMAMYTSVDQRMSLLDAAYEWIAVDAEKQRVAEALLFIVLVASSALAASAACVQWRSMFDALTVFIRTTSLSTIFFALAAGATYALSTQALASLARLTNSPPMTPLELAADTGGMLSDWSARVPAFMRRYVAFVL